MRRVVAWGRVVREAAVSRQEGGRTSGGLRVVGSSSGNNIYCEECARFQLTEGSSDPVSDIRVNILYAAGAKSDL